MGCLWGPTTVLKCQNWEHGISPDMFNTALLQQQKGSARVLFTDPFYRQPGSRSCQSLSGQSSSSTVILNPRLSL